MKIKLTQTYDDGDCHMLEIENENTYYICPLYDCPEDAVIGRGLIDAHDLLYVLKIGYEAGKRGDTLEIEEVEE